jgi:NAD(P)H-hydrate epimerase
VKINKNIFPKRKAESHKGSYGRVFILAGSPGMLGAAILVSRGALRAGAGLVYLDSPKESRDIVNIATPEVIIVSGSQSAINADALAIGPGLGSRKKTAFDLLVDLNKKKFKKPIILDADGLNAFEGKINTLRNLNLNLILTPHPGELARLLSKTTDELLNDREKAAREAAELLGHIIVLKGHRTTVAGKNGKVYINKTGNPGMASAGAGDVLTGVIAGLAAQGLNLWDAACAGVYLHGLAGDLAAAELGEYGMIASDIIDHLPKAIIKAQKK